MKKKWSSVLPGDRVVLTVKQVLDLVETEPRLYGVILEMSLPPRNWNPSVYPDSEVEVVEEGK